MTDHVVTLLRAAGCVFAEREAALLRAAASGTDLQELVDRRCAGERLEDVLGWAEFDGHRYRIAPGVFVPRQRTRFLLDLAVACTAPGAVVVDICCGTGALGGALRHRAGPFSLHATDIDPAAVQCAHDNLPGAHVVQGDLFAALPHDLRGRVDVLLANVPYVPSAQVDHLPVEMRQHERRTALDGGLDGVDVLRRVVAQAPEWLSPGGSSWCELDEGQVPAALAAVPAPLLARVHPGDDSSCVLQLVQPTNTSRGSVRDFGSGGA